MCGSGPYHRRDKLSSRVAAGTLWRRAGLHVVPGGCASPVQGLAGVLLQAVVFQVIAAAFGGAARVAEVIDHVVIITELHVLQGEHRRGFRVIVALSLFQRRFQSCLDVFLPGNNLQVAKVAINNLHAGNQPHVNV